MPLVIPRLDAGKSTSGFNNIDLEDYLCIFLKLLTLCVIGVSDMVIMKIVI